MLHQVLAVAWELTKRSAISAIASIAVFLVGAGLMHTIGFRQVKRPVFVPNGAGDLFQSICSLAFGSPLLMAFLILNEYKPICQAYVGPIGPTWPAYAWWLLSVPLYLWLWDLVFYCTHLVLHTKPVYDYSHHKHHAFRPPTAYSAIAIDPLETILSGLMPFVIPLFIAPFHLPTVFALNGMAMWWATMLHSSWAWNAPTWLMSPVDHNNHHARGMMNRNYAAFFTIFDRLGHTLDRSRLPPWMEQEAQQRASKAVLLAKPMSCEPQQPASKGTVLVVSG